MSYRSDPLLRTEIADLRYTFMTSAQALVHGAKLLQVDGSFDDCLELARKLAVDYPVALVLPVDAQITAVAPRPTAVLTATVMPRSLNDPVGLPASTLR